MSEGEYQALMGLMEMEDLDLGRPAALDEPEGSWRTMDGRVLRVSEMSAGHLNNAISLFARNGHGGEPKILELVAELARRSR